jgi:hypothetical protein
MLKIWNQYYNKNCGRERALNDFVQNITGS